MKTTGYNKHLTLDERKIILKGIENNSSKQAIANTIGKDPSTIAKEIKLHRYLKVKCCLIKPCSNYKHCKFNRECSDKCSSFSLFTCSRRDRSPGACNGCSYYSKCRFDKYFYSPDFADNTYHELLVSSREGLNLSPECIKHLSNIIVPAIKNGLSPFDIISLHPDLNISEKSIYNYIEWGVFKDYGLIDIDLRRKVSRKLPKSKRNMYKLRSDRKHLINRTFSNFIAFKNDNPYAKIVEMDTVYNNESTGPFIQTFLFYDSYFLFAVLHDEKTNNAMINGFNFLDDILGKSVFNEFVYILKTDRGSEFVKPELFEYRKDGSVRTHMFYCDPMMAGQKGRLENRHELLRYICPKQTNLYTLGLISQDKLNLAISHINSTPLQSLNGKSPFEYVQFMFPDLYKRFCKYGLKKIDKDKIILKPYLLK